MYSHDTLGLGHLRRCREIAHHLVESNSRLSVLILSGSPIIGSFDFRTRVDFVRIPGVIKLRKDEILKIYPDISKAKNLLKWFPKINFHVGLSSTIRSYEKK